ncbi:right-handed parallel beta-helix repeat-containing protein [Sphingomonas arantia]|uniref:Right-handed parallel beta-helix repeat-containing protein n=1 Tax=Sphingomonas arantia TaxID=1460676 RepID=A0ABW4U484_9SPHN
MKKLILAAALLSASAFAQGSGPFTVAETGRGFFRLQDAVNAIGGGDGTIRIAPGTYKDCAIVSDGRVAFAAVTAGTAIFDGGVCEGKATLVLRGRDAAVDGLVFRGVTVPDHNGAGIRLEKGNLTVTGTAFRDSEQGILTTDDPAQVLTVRRSTFSGLGTCEGAGGCAHGLYTGTGGTLELTNNRFERGRGGHYAKARARRVTIVDNSFDDTQGKATNYMIDLSSGATGRIVGNEFVMGKDKENHSAFITVAPEARTNPSAGLVITGNRASLAPGVSWPSNFVADWSHEPLKISGNQLGKGITLLDVRN